MNFVIVAMTLTSDSTFGRGDGLAGLVDAEVLHDEAGLPYLGGRALRGLLRDECAQLLFSLDYPRVPIDWVHLADTLFGVPGSDDASAGILQVGDATVPGTLREAVHAGVKAGDLTREQVLQSLTTVRRQTAINAESGSAKRKSLRASRVVIRGLQLEAVVRLQPGLAVTDHRMWLLAACVAGLRRVGTGRTRGRGEVQMTLRGADGNDIGANSLQQFMEVVG